MLSGTGGPGPLPAACLLASAAAAESYDPWLTESTEQQTHQARDNNTLYPRVFHPGVANTVTYNLHPSAHSSILPSHPTARLSFTSSPHSPDAFSSRCSTHPFCHDSVLGFSVCPPPPPSVHATSLSPSHSPITRHYPTSRSQNPVCIWQVEPSPISFCCQSGRASPIVGFPRHTDCHSSLIQRRHLHCPKSLNGLASSADSDGSRVSTSGRATTHIHNKARNG